MITNVYVQKITKEWEMKPTREGRILSATLVEKEQISDFERVTWFNNEMIADVVTNKSILVNGVEYKFIKSEYFHLYRDIYLSETELNKPIVIDKKTIKFINNHIQSLTTSLDIEFTAPQKKYYQQTLDEQLNECRKEVGDLENKLFEARAWLGGFILLSMVIMILYITTGGSV